jgi:hypothetical protein
MNVPNGIKVHAFHNAHKHRDDRELALLTKSVSARLLS